LADRYGERPVIAVAYLIQFVGMAVLVTARGISGYAVSSAVFGLGIGGLIPAYDALVSKAIPEKMRGIAFGVFGTSIGLISLPAPWAGAQLWERFGARFPFAITAGAVLLCALSAWTRFSSRQAPASSPELQPAAEGQD
jgi:MFS family permease